MAEEFKALEAYQRQTEALGRIAQRLGWDHETVMPKGAAGDRSEEMASLEATVHARNTSSELGDLLDSVCLTDLDPVERRQYDLILRSFEKTKKIPADLSIALARITARSHAAWAQAKSQNDTSIFLPLLSEVVNLSKQKAAAIAQDTDLSAYDALFREYEPDGQVADVAAMFAELRPALVDLRSAVLQAAPAPQLSGQFPRELQLALTQEIAGVFGYDLSRGRIDVALHPFSTGGGNDVRITTRFDDARPFDSLYSTIHEVGHATYEQNIDAAYNFTILGQGTSLGVHESQSRIYENQLARSREFCGWLYGRMRDVFGDIGIDTEFDFYRAVNAVTRGFIRTEADELQYNLHIMLRFDLERAMISGDLAVEDVEAAWNDRFASDFGYAVDRPAHGMLQDIHWSEGLLGYFPTYSIGNIYAGNLWAKINQDVPNLGHELAQGNTTAARNWLRENVQRHGASMPAPDLIAQACGTQPTAAPFVEYITQKFSAFV